MRKHAFAEIRRDAPPIFVSRSDETRFFLPQEQDAQYDARPYSSNFIEGTGSRRRPFTYVSAAPVSAHYAILDMWFKFRGRRSRPVFIEVNDWVLRVYHTGVRAENGTFTRLT